MRHSALIAISIAPLFAASVTDAAATPKAARLSPSRQSSSPVITFGIPKFRLPGRWSCS
jgi:hypothetical protein